MNDLPTHPVPHLGFNKLELEKRLTEATMLKHIVATAGAPLEPVTVLNVICAELIEVVGVQHAGFARLNDDGEALTIISEYGEGNSGNLGAQIPLENNEITQLVLSRRQPVAVLDAQNDPRMGAAREVAKAFGVASMLIVPIISGRRVVGTLGLDSYVLREFNEDEIEIIQSASAAAAPLLENAELFDQLRAELRHRQQTETELRRSRMIYQELVNSLEGVVWEGEFRDGGLHCTFISRQAERLFGYTSERFLGLRETNLWNQVFQSDDWAALNLRLRHAMKTLEPLEIEARAYDDQGELMWVQDRITFAQVDDHVRVRGLMVNITEHKRSVRLERERNQILELIARNIDLEEVMARICELATSQFQRAGCAISAVRSGHLELVATHGLPSSIRTWLQRSVGLSEFKVWAQQLEQSGATIFDPRLTDSERDLLIKHDFRTVRSLPILVSGQAIGVVTVFLPSTTQRNFRVLHTTTELSAIAIDRNTLLEQLEYRASHDPLTDLPNRALYQERLIEAMRQADLQKSLVGLLYIDLDNFKFVNDNFSHATGDELLKNIARQLSVETSASSTVARLGGDEFAVILPNLQLPEEAAEIAAQLAKSLTTKVVIGTHQHEVSASIGMAIYPSDGATTDELSNAADHSMYHAKHQR
jgi:diguanylate cyclase (GGDEF)-like protein/PAS domain S-box-containing protein